MQENTDQNISEYGHFARSDWRDGKLLQNLLAWFNIGACINKIYGFYDNFA